MRATEISTTSTTTTTAGPAAASIPTSTSVPTFAGTGAGAASPAATDDGARAGLLFVAAGIILLFLVLRRAQRRNARETRDAGRPPRRFPGR